MTNSLTILLMMVVLTCEINTIPTYASNQNMVGDMSIHKDGRACIEPHKILGHLFERGQKITKGKYIRTEEIRKKMSDSHKGQRRSKATIEKQRKSMAGKLVKNLKSQRFGRLIVIEEAGRRKDKSVLWECLCDCSNITIVGGRDLSQGKTRSCGCLMSELAQKRMAGRKVSEEIKQKLREYTGAKASGWRGGISKLPYSFDFDEELKELIRKRDNHKCQLCGTFQNIAGRKMSIHHIDYNKQNASPQNLIALCNSCNSKVNHNRKSWTRFFQSKIKESKSR